MINLRTVRVLISLPVLCQLLSMMKIGFIGAGRMAQALAKGFISAGLTKGDQIIASCAPDDTISAEAFKSFGASVEFENNEIVKKQPIVVLAVKPSVVPSVLKDIRKSVTKENLILSVAMGVSIQQLEKGLPVGTRVMRVMPNTAAIIQKAASVFVCGSSTKPEDVEVTQKLLTSIGTCEGVPESLIDAVTALSASGPAYIYVLIEALADGAVRMGMTRDLAYRLAAQTVVGAGQMVLDTKEHPAVLKDNVTSPAGSTAEGLFGLEEGGFRAAIIRALELATKRCKEVNQKTNTN